MQSIRPSATQLINDTIENGMDGFAFMPILRRVIAQLQPDG
ncbi:MAG: hypothetical protein ACFB03_21220 [Paracoccaceae bacterium]